MNGPALAGSDALVALQVLEPDSASLLSGIIVVTSAITLYGLVSLPVGLTDPPLEPADPWFWVDTLVAPALLFASAAVLSGPVNELLVAFVLTLLWLAAQTIGMVAERRRDATDS